MVNSYRFLRGVTHVSAALLLIGGAFGVESSAPTPSALKAMNYVVVSPEGPADGGDFGPHTANTKTSGIQEAFDAAKANRKDVYIAGGTMPGTFKPGVIYHTQETIRIPWFQDFRLDGGEYVINYDKTDGDALVIDSQMSCRFKFGLIVSPSNGVAVRIKPKTKGPDGFAVVTCSTFEFNAVVGAGSVFPDGKKRPAGTGLYLDASAGPILHNRIYATEIIACETGISMDCGASGNPVSTVSENFFELPFVHLCGVHIALGNAASNVSRNTFHANINSENQSDATGIRIYGKRNLLTLDIQTEAKNKGIIFEAPAEDNRATVVNLPAGYTNNATRPTNKILEMGAAGFAIETPPVPASGVPLVNRTPYSIEAIVVSAGAVTAWSLTDCSGRAQTIPASLILGQTISLEPGESIMFTYTQAPSWRWRAR